MNRIGTETIETKRCILRKIFPEDYGMMYHNWAKYGSFIDVAQYAILKEL